MTDDKERNRGARLPWWPEERQIAPPRAPLTRDQIVAKAIEIADREGLGALSMRRLSQELGAAPTSLYWRIRNKDELLDLATDRIVGETGLEDDPSLPWEERLTRFATSTRAMFRRHPGIAPLIGARITLGPNLLRSVDVLVGILRSAGFEGIKLGLAYQVVLTFASGYGVMESRHMSGPGLEGLTPAERQAKTVERYAAIPADDFPNLIEALPVALQAPEDAPFEYGLRLLVDGLAADVGRTHGDAGRQQFLSDLARPS